MVPSCKDFEEPSSISSAYARPEQPGSLGLAPLGTSGDIEASGTTGLESRNGSDRRRSGGGGGSGRRESSGSNFDHHEAKSAVVFAMLEASLRCCHGWLCEEAFREAAAMMGNGDGEGLPPAPRELTAVIVLLQHFLSLLWVADSSRPNTGGREDGIWRQAVN